MQVQNPMIRLYKKLAGNWKNTDGSCTANLMNEGKIEISYGGGNFSSSYSVFETDPLSYEKFRNHMGLFALQYEPHIGEEMMFQMGDPAIWADGKRIYNIDCIWYGLGKLNLELTAIQDGHKESIALERDDEGSSQSAGPAGTYQCLCGQNFKSKFCPNCGKPCKEASYNCECGYSGPVGKFCPNCGKAVG